MSREQQLRDRNPTKVVVHDYLARMRAGTMPRPEECGADSWVDSHGTRTFGFKDKAEAKAFIDRWRLGP